MDRVGRSPEGALRRLRRRLWLERVFFLAVIAGVAYCAFGPAGPSRSACLITADGKPVAVVTSEASAERLLEEYKRTAGDPGQVSFLQEVTLHRVRAKGERVVTDSEALQAFATRLTRLLPAAGLYADGRLLVAFPDRAQAVDMLSFLLRELSPPDPDLTRAFRQQVKIREGRLPAEKVARSVQEAEDRFLQDIASRGSYRVARGDSASAIAARQHVRVADLARANPGRDFGRLREGEEIILPGSTPPVTVVAWKEIERPWGSGLTQTVRITYENGVLQRERVVRRPPRRGHELGTRAEEPDRARRSSRGTETGAGTTE